MALFDIIVMDLLWKYILLIIMILLVVYFVLWEKIKAFQERLLHGFCGRFIDSYDVSTEDIKTKLFGGMASQVSGVTDLKNQGLIRILEVGVGFGANLKFFPEKCRLVVVDPSIKFQQYFNEQMGKYPDMILEKFIQCKGENMLEVPTESVDAVVSTIVLCSVSDVKQVLREIQRVLVSGGKFYYVEHIADEPSTKLYKIQRLMTKLIWHRIFDCYLDRNTADEILNAGFSKVDQQLIRIDSSNFKVLKLIEPHVVGVATK